MNTLRSNPSVNTPVNALSCVWIETGNPTQPLACVWMHDNLTLSDFVRETQEESEGERCRLCV